jgi:hypothetical protein
MASVTLWTVFAVGAALRCWVAVLPERLLIRVTVDDAFYYFRTAQELVSGNGPTFDGTHVTNGFHPLWMAVIAPFAATGLDGSALVRVLVVVQASASMAAFALLVRVLRPRLGTWATAAGLSWWWLSPPSVITSVSGVEASVTTLAVVLTIAAAVAYVEDAGRRTAIWMGVAGAAVFLARSDAAFAVVAIGTWAAFDVGRRGRTPRTVARDVATAAVVAAAIVTPWWVWNLLTFGTVEQSSAAARPRVLWNAEAAAGRADDLSETVRTGVVSAARTSVEIWPLMLGWSPLLFVGAALCAVLVGRRSGFAPGWPRRLALLGGSLIAAGTLLVVFHSGVRLFAREYYFEWTRMSVGLVVAAVVAGLAPGSRALLSAGRGAEAARAAALLAIAAIAALGVTRSVAALRSPPFPWQPEMLEAARWLDGSVPPGDTVASFNAGIIGFYSGRDVVNLDGAINNAAAEALAQRDLAAVICSSGAQWYADFDPLVWDEHVDFLGADADRLVLEPVHEVPGHGNGGSSMVIQRLDCDAR